MKRIMRLALLLTLVMAATTYAQESPKTPPTPAGEREPTAPTQHAQLGIAGQVSIGDPAPDFELDGSRGVPVRLSRTRGDWVVLAFAERRDQLASLRTIEKELLGSGVRIVGVCHEKARTLDNYAGRDTLPLLLADVTGEVASSYGLYDSANRQIVPGFMVLDRGGIVRIAFLGRLLPPEEISRLTQFAVTGL